MNLENIILNDARFHVLEVPRGVTFIGTENRFPDPGPDDREVFTVRRLPVLQDESTSVDGWCECI